MKIAKILGMFSAICSFLGTILLYVYWDNVVFSSNYPNDILITKLSMYTLVVAMILSVLSEISNSKIWIIGFIRFLSLIGFAIFVVCSFFPDEPLKGVPGFVFLLVILAVITRIFSYLIAVVTEEKIIPKY